MRHVSEFLIVLSPAAVDSQEVRGELRTALDEGKRITPILYQSCCIPRQLRTVQYVDFTARGVDDATALDQVVQVLGGEPASPPPPLPPKTPPLVSSPSQPKTGGWFSWFSLPRVRMRCRSLSALLLCSLLWRICFLRGGSWYLFARNLRVFLRNRDDPDSRNVNIGFRCAEEQTVLNSGFWDPGA